MARNARRRVERSPAKERRLERRRLERERRASLYWEDSGRIVCDRCGLEQAFRSSDARAELASCAGPLGLSCAGETAITIEHYLELAA